MSERPTVAVTIGRGQYHRVMSQQAWDALHRFARVVEHPGTEAAQKADLLSLLPEADGCITGWGVAPLDTDVIAAAPRLQIVAHAAGTIKTIISEAAWQRGITVTSAAPAIAERVAETTLALMIVGIKGLWPLARGVSAGGWRDGQNWPSREFYHKTVGIISASHVGRALMRLLQHFRVEVLLYDPTLTGEEAAALGARQTDLNNLLHHADIVSLHAPSLPETRHLLNAENLPLMKDQAILINTARGALIEEVALIAELSKGRLFAFLDVTDPEPPRADNPLRKLPNVVLTPHVAGCVDDCTMLGEMAVEELRRYFHHEPPLNRVTRAMLAHIA